LRIPETTKSTKEHEGPQRKAVLFLTTDYTENTVPQMQASLENIGNYKVLEETQKNRIAKEQHIRTNEGVV
jgi:hypothetical protein